MKSLLPSFVFIAKSNVYCTSDRSQGVWAGSPFNSQAAFEWLKGCCGRVGVPFRHIHSLRHLHASLLIFEGIDVVAGSADMGHSVVGTTSNIYCDMLEEVQAKIS
ncbi:MAG: tyrosine-type recombinase/integrase [Ruminococcus sp.]|nr:tyrosine-type recombinase/integrase [Ruminococcus sp.]